MFSTRLNWNTPVNQLSRLLSEKKANGVELIDLTVSNPTAVGLQFPLQDIRSAFGSADYSSYEPDPRGMVLAREAVSSYLSSTGQLTAPNELFLTASTSEGYSWVFKLLCDPGDEILVPSPSYPLFDYLAALEGVIPVKYPLIYSHPTGWSIDMEALESGIGPRTRAIVVVSPNNPTGSFLTQKDFGDLEKICAKHELPLIVDEVFRDYGLEAGRELERRLISEKALVFSLNGFSKMLCLPQMKLGWIRLSGSATLVEKASEKLELIADSYLSCGAPVQLAAPRWLDLRQAIQQPLIDRLGTNINLIRSMTEGTACRTLHIDGGWTAIIEVPRILSEEQLILELLRDSDVLIHPGYFFDFEREAYLVLSLIQRTEILEDGLKQILKRF